ncbi:MAG: CopD family protein [Alphaproteobacteria bacterium]
MPDAWTAATVLVKALCYGGALAAAGGALFLPVFAAAPAAVRRTARRQVAAAVPVAAAAALLLIPLRAGYLAGGSLDGALDAVMLQIVVESPLGPSVFLRCAGLTLALAALHDSPAGRGLGALGAVAVAASFALVGHSLAEPRPLLAALVVLHLCAAAYWVGALLPLAAATRLADTAGAAALLARFGRIAAVVVALLVVAGAALAAVLLGGLAPLWSTPYGNVLAVKLAAVVGLLLLAAGNKWRLVPALAAGRPQAAARLRRAIRLEIGFAVGVLLATAWLTRVTTAPVLMTP